jgi:hypothetical protein
LTFAVAGFLAVLFALSFRLSGVADVCGRVVLICRSAAATFFDAQQSDMQKEQAARAAARALLRSLLEIAARIAGAALPPAAVAWLLDLFGVLSLADVLAGLQTWPLILMGAVAMLVVFMIGK